MSDTPALPPLPTALSELLGQVSTATLSTQLLKRGFRNLFMHEVLPLRPDLRMVGPAFTLRYIPAREDLGISADYNNLTNKQRIAVETIGPGEVLVIDARGNTHGATLGNILATRIKGRGAAGVVTDGAFRDAPLFRAIDLPTYARGQHPNLSATIHHAVEMNVPIGCAGVAVLPGDVVVGDAEGVIVIPRALAEEVARDAYEQERRETFILSKIEAGSSILGVYPPDENTLREFEAWEQQQRQG